MNANDERYTRFALVREMLDAAGVIDVFNANRTKRVAEDVCQCERLMLTGEGSSRIFPAKNARRKALTWGLKLHVATDGARQAAAYDLNRFAVFAASNSGRTKEVISLMRRLTEAGHEWRYGVTANHGTPLADLAVETFVLACGPEQAPAATKSVVEQALVYQSVVSHLAGRDMESQLETLNKKFEAALSMPIDPAIVAKALAAPTVYFAGWNDGVAEELTLKANAIARKKSDFLEGTYVLHGIEEVMQPTDLVVVVDPIAEEVEKFRDVLVKGVGLTVVAIADRPTIFPTIQVPPADEFTPFVYLAAGWNLLVEVGLALNLNLDTAVRARKVGNELAQ